MLGVFWAPVMALVADVAEANGIDQAHAAALMNLAWAAGQIIGSAGERRDRQGVRRRRPDTRGDGAVRADAWWA